MSLRLGHFVQNLLMVPPWTEDSQSPCMMSKATDNLAPRSLPPAPCPSMERLTPLQHTGLHGALRVCQARSCLRMVALAIVCLECSSNNMSGHFSNATFSVSSSLTPTFSVLLPSLIVMISI